MKRRNADFGKIRGRKRKITEGSNTFLYMKFLMLWAVVITADFLLEFRFEFLWPFWLLLRSVHDSFKYKGLAFSVLFVCIALTSDVVCLFFIPVHWLFFAASTYVWVQYVWHTDKGICLPTIILWILFVYLEAAVRWKDSKNMPHLNLCRPFAAHCIGYPVVTLGFGFKSYVGYQIRQRKQREVAKENEFYMQLLQQALPQDEPAATVLSGDQQQIIEVCGQSNNSSSKNTTSNVQLPTVAATTNHNHSNKNAQNTNKLLNNNLSNNSTTSTNSNGTIGAAPSSSSTTPNGIGNHNTKTHHHHHRKSLEKEPKCDTTNNHPNHQSHNNHEQHNNSNLTTSNLNIKSSTSPTSSSSQHTTHHHLNHSNKDRSTASDYVSTTNASSPKDKDKENCYQKQQDVEKDKYFHNDKENLQQTYKSIQYTKAVAGADSKLQNGDNSAHQYDQQHPMDDGLSESAGTTTATVTPSSTINTGMASEKIRSGRKNRVKQKETTLKDNHTTNLLNNHNTQNDVVISNNNSNNLNSCSTTATTTQPPPTSLATSIVNKICESCLRFEAEMKKLKSEVNIIRQIEMELRQKCETQWKSCLQAKQKENDELQIKIQDLQSTRQLDRQNFQTIERRLGDERRQKQTLESQLSNERKYRKLAEEKVARAECGEACKLKKQQMELDLNKLRRDLAVSVDAKQHAEKQSRSFEHELRKYEQDLRNRGEAQQSNEVLMSALAAMQDKNSTLEKNLSAETRVKLDLFSALGEAKRQLEIRENFIRNKEKEVIDLQAKIAQLLAVMPSMPSESSYNLPGASNSGVTSGSGLRLSDAPQLLPPIHNTNSQQQHNHQHHHQSNGGGSGASSPILQVLGQQHQQAHSPSLMSQLSSMGCGVLSSAMSSPSLKNGGINGMSAAQQLQLQQQQQGQKLDPNASVYTPKNSMIGD